MNQRTLFLHSLRSDEEVIQRNAESYIREEFELLDTYFSHVEEARRSLRKEYIPMPDEKDVQIMAYSAGIQRANHGKLWNWLYRHEPLNEYLDEMAINAAFDLRGSLEDQVSMLIGSVQSAATNLNAFDGQKLISEFYGSKYEYVQEQLKQGKLDFTESYFIPNALSRTEIYRASRLFNGMTALRFIHIGYLASELGLESIEMNHQGENYIAYLGKIETKKSTLENAIPGHAQIKLNGPEDDVRSVKNMMLELSNAKGSD